MFSLTWTPTYTSEATTAKALVISATLTHAALGDKHILWLIDEGTIDAGVSPLIVRMIQRGLVRQIAMTGAAAVRDYELSYYGMTHEEVGPGLEDGLLGMSRETGEGMSAIINEGVRRGFGLGECLGRGILDRQPKYFTQSILAACSARLVPSTIHVSIGSDGFHRHPNADGALLGKGSLKDAQILSARIEKLDGGGVVVAAHGSSALHEVFLLAYGASRNLAGPIKDVTLLRLGEKELDFSAVPGIETDLNVPGPLELTIPLFTGALFSLVE